jgi:glycosyltransferase involved in cell wall biosynthesis
MATAHTYVLVSAARNEEAYIERTIRAVTAQTCAPTQWLIVSDGSTDKTDEIVHRYADLYPFIKLWRVQLRRDRSFGSKAMAINDGYEMIRHLEHEFVGILDVDITFSTQYYERVMAHMDAQPDLGIAGGILYDVWDGRPVRHITSTRWSVSGAVQMFRKQCWQRIGGYLPVPGGIDAVAEIMTRMQGLKVQTFPELHVWHHRRTGSHRRGLVGILWRRGVEDYEIGYHPLFFFLRAMRRSLYKPLILSGTTMLAGYAWASIKRNKRRVPEDFVRFLRHEQMGRLLRLLQGKGHTQHDRD